MRQKDEPDYDRGTVRYLASELEIPPRLAVAGGPRAAAAMAELKKAHIAGSGGMRQNHVVEAQKHIAAIDPRQHKELLQHLQSVVVTLGGKPDHTVLAHMTPGEIVVPPELRTPELMAALRATAEAQGVDLSRYLVGSRDNSVNPRTGEAEFFDPSQGYADAPYNSEPVMVAAANDAPPPSSNDNFPRHAEACREAGWECVGAGLSPDERAGCFPAEQECHATAEAYKDQPPDVSYVGRFPHGRTVIIPGGGKPPYLGPMMPRRRTP